MSEFVEDLRERAVGTMVRSLGHLGVSESVARMVADEWIGDIMRDWRGERPYLGSPESERARMSERNRAIIRDWRAGERVPLIARRYGISRVRVWQIVKGAGKAPALPALPAAG